MLFWVQIITLKYTVGGGEVGPFGGSATQAFWSQHATGIKDFIKGVWEWSETLLKVFGNDGFYAGP